jgi:hypothetical protein
MAKSHDPEKPKDDPTTGANRAKDEAETRAQATKAAAIEREGSESMMPPERPPDHKRDPAWDRAAKAYLEDQDNTESRDTVIAWVKRCGPLVYNDGSGPVQFRLDTDERLHVHAPNRDVNAVYDDSEEELAAAKTRGKGKRGKKDEEE